MYMPSFERNEIEPTLAVGMENVRCVTPDGTRYGSDLATMGGWMDKLTTGATDENTKLIILYSITTP